MLGIREKVTEFIAELEGESVVWKEYHISPSPKYQEVFMLMTPEQLFNMIFPTTGCYYRIKPCAVSDLIWNNHLNSLLGVICEMKRYFSPHLTFTQLMLELRPRILSEFQPVYKITPGKDLNLNNFKTVKKFWKLTDLVTSTMN